MRNLTLGGQCPPPQGCLILACFTHHDARHLAGSQDVLTAGPVSSTSNILSLHTLPAPGLSDKDAVCSGEGFLNTLAMWGQGGLGGQPSERPEEGRPWEEVEKEEGGEEEAGRVAERSDLDHFQIQEI